MDTSIFSVYRIGYYNEKRVLFKCPYCEHTRKTNYYNYGWFKARAYKHIREEHPNETEAYKKRKSEQSGA